MTTHYAMPRICSERILPADLRANTTPVTTPEGAAAAAVFVSKKWLNGSTLKVRFVGGTTTQRNIV
ncbi:MAG: hypothetical protein WBA46_18660, partial [Thermomicrobiales bacterium]